MAANPQLTAAEGSPRARIREWFPELLFLALTTAAAFWAGGRWLDPLGNPGFGWSLAYRLGHGERLYRDVYLAYGPLSPYLLAASGKIFGFSSLWFLLVNWIAAIAAAVLLMRCGRPFLGALERIALAGLILAIALWVPGPGRLILPYYPGVVHALALSLAAFLLLQPGRGSEKTRLLLAGSLAGLAFCAKQELGLAAALALLASRLPRRRAALSSGAWILAGFALVVILGAAVVLASASPQSLVENNHLWPLDPTPPTGLDRIFTLSSGLSIPNWTLPLRQSAGGVLVLLVVLAAIAMFASRERRLSPWLPVALSAGVLAVWWVIEPFPLTPRTPISLSAIVAAIVTLAALLSGGLPQRPLLIAIGTFAVLANLRAVFSQTLSAHYDGPSHFVSGLTWLLFLCVLAPRLLAPVKSAEVWMRRGIAVLLLVGAGILAISGARTLRSPQSQAVSTPRGDVFPDRAHAVFYEALGKELAPGERVLVVPEINGVDALFSVRSVSPLLDHLPGWLDEDREKELVARFEREPPDAVVLFERALPEFEVRALGEGYGSLLAAWIHRNYRPVVTLTAGTILRRERSAAAGVGRGVSYNRPP